MAAVGLKSYILNNNLKSAAMLAGFPVLLVLLIYGLELVLMGSGYLPRAEAGDNDFVLALRMMATKFLKNYSSNGINPPTDSVGQNSGSGPPNWRWRGSATYTNESFNLGLIARGVSSGVYSNLNIECTSGCPVATSRNPTTNNNHIDGAVYWDTSFTYKFNVVEDVQMETFLNIKNIMNTDPVISAPGPGGFAYEAAPANGNLYDTLGRVFRAGVRFKM